MHLYTRPWFLAALLVLLISCGAPSSPASNQTTAPAAQGAEAPAVSPFSTATAISKPTATPEAVEPGASRSAPLPLGTELRFTNWAVMISAVVRGDEAARAIANANQFNDPAPPGWQYLLATLKLTNISTEQTARSALLGVDVRVTGQRSLLYDRASVVPPRQLEGELFPGGSVEGQIAFLVPVDEGNLMFYVAEFLSFDRNGRRFVAIDEGAVVRPDSVLATLTPTDTGASRANPAPLGVTTISENWEITVLEALRGIEAARRVAEANMFNEPAPEGEEYLLARVRARYLGRDDPDVMAQISQSDFRATGAANVVYERPLVVAPEPRLDAYLFPGGQVEGWLVVQVPADETGLTLVFQPGFALSDKNVRFFALE